MDIHEVSRKKIAKYMKGAYEDLSYAQETSETNPHWKGAGQWGADWRAMRREKGLNNAVAKMMKTAKVPANEAIEIKHTPEENLNEVSKGLMGRYLDKARWSLKHGSKMAGAHTWADGTSASASKAKADHEKKAEKRATGIGLVSRKLMKEDAVNEGEVNRNTTSRPTIRRLTPTEILNKKLGRERAQNAQARIQVASGN